MVFKIWHIHTLFFKQKTESLASLQSLAQVQTFLKSKLQMLGFDGCQADMKSSISVSDKDIKFSFADGENESAIKALSGSQFALKRTHEFKIGDNVRITDCHQSWDSSIRMVRGYIIEIKNEVSWLDQAYPGTLFLYPLKHIHWTHKNKKLYQGREPLALLDNFNATRDKHQLKIKLSHASHDAKIIAHIR